MPALRVHVMFGPQADDVAGRLRAHDATGLLTVAAVEQPGPAALVIATGRSPATHAVADVVLDGDLPLPPQVDQLWSERLAQFARTMAGILPFESGPPVWRPHDRGCRRGAERLLGRMRESLTGLGLDDGRWTYDHIGSTSVPGLLAKPIIDLQIGAVPLPEEGSPADDVLAGIGYLPTRGSRPDSPGVYRDEVKDPDLAPADAYRKRLYVRPDPGLPAVLHVRQLGCPWWSYTVQFRDWLRTSPANRRAYEAMKQQAAAAHAHDVDYDDYTRAKGAFFDRNQFGTSESTARKDGAERAARDNALGAAIALAAATPSVRG